MNLPRLHGLELYLDNSYAVCRLGHKVARVALACSIASRALPITGRSLNIETLKAGSRSATGSTRTLSPECSLSVVALQVRDHVRLPHFGYHLRRPVKNDPICMYASARFTFSQCGEGAAYRPRQKAVGHTYHPQYPALRPPHTPLR